MNDIFLNPREATKGAFPVAALTRPIVNSEFNSDATWADGVFLRARWAEPAARTLGEEWLLSKPDKNFQKRVVEISRRHVLPEMMFHFIRLTLRKKYTRQPRELKAFGIGREMQYNFFTMWEALEANILPVKASQRFVGQTRFLPSVSLAAFWIKGIDAHIDASTNKEKIRDALPDQLYEQPREEFARQFKRQIGNLANRYRYGEIDASVLGENGKFSVVAQHEILDRFHIVPDESTPFFYLLYSELQNYLAGEGKFGGSWGELSLENGQIIIKATEPFTAQPGSEWEPATVIE